MWVLCVLRDVNNEWMFLMPLVLWTSPWTDDAAVDVLGEPLGKTCLCF